MLNPSTRLTSQDIWQDHRHLQHLAQETIGTIVIQPMQESDIHEATLVLCQALFSNPIQVAVYQSHHQKTQDCIQKNFNQVLRDRHSQSFVARLNEKDTDLSASKIIGVYRMKRCSGRPFCVLNQLASNLSTLTIQEREQSWLESWASHDPMQHHSHLGPIGVLPKLQGQGIGTQLLQHYCHYLETHHLSAYLEADKWQNVGFYEKFRFKIVEKAEILGIQNYFMWRDIDFS